MPFERRQVQRRARSASPGSRSYALRVDVGKRSTSGRTRPPRARRYAARAGRPRTCSSRRRARRRPRPRARPSRPRPRAARRGTSAARDESANGSSNASASAGRSNAASGRRTSSRCIVPYRSATRRASASSSNDRSSKPIENVRSGSLGLVGRERGEHARVDAAGEQHADRHVADEVRAHRVAQPRAELLDELGLVLAPTSRCRRGAGPREALELDACRLATRARGPGGSLRVLPEDRLRRRHRVEREERLERVEVDLAARQRAQLGRERELAGDGAVVERLDPVAVAREHEPALASRPRSRSRTCRAAARRTPSPTPRTRARSPRCRRACGTRGPRARARRVSSR